MSLSSRSDQYTLEMRMDHKQFDSGVSTTLSTLDKLKSALNMSGATKGLDEITPAAKNASDGLSGLAQAVQNVSNWFTPMGRIANQVLTNITNDAYAAGKKIVEALTITPVKTGFEEYELKMDSIKTILSNTNGKNSLEEIKEVLEGLNKYADDTIYNFGQMTSAMGKMSAQGIDLYDAEKAVRGMSNLAAYVGSSAQGYTNALNFGLVQALAMGSLRLQDWKSFENANISSKVFRDELIKTADDMNYFGKTWYSNQGQAITGMQLMEDASEHFRETLKYGWVDNNVLLTTLAKFADTTTELGQKAQAAAREVRTVTKLKDALLESLQSGWAYTWEYIIGDVDEATKVLTRISDALSSIFNKAADERNAAFKQWHDNPINGRETFISAFAKVWDYVTKIMTVFDEVKKKVFGNDALYKMLSRITEWLDNFAYSLEWNTTISHKFYNIFYGAMSIVDIVLNAISAWLRALSPILEPVGKLFGFLFDILAKIGEKIAAFNNWAKTGDIYYKFLQNIINAFKTFIKPITDVIDRILRVAKAANVVERSWRSIKTIFDNLFTGISEAFGDLKNRIIAFYDQIKSSEAFTFLTNMLSKVQSKIVDFGSKGILRATSWLERLSEKKINIKIPDFSGLKTVFDTLKLAWPTVENALTTIANYDYGAAFDKAKNKVTELKDQFKAFADSHPLVATAIDKIKIAFEPLTNIVGKVVDWIKSLKDMFKLTNPDIEYFSNGVVEYFDNVASSESIFDRLKAKAKDSFKSIIDWFERLTGLKITLPQIDEKGIKQSFESLKIKVKDYFAHLSDNETFTSLKSSIETTFGNAFNKINEFLENANLQEKLDTLGGWFQKFIDDIGSGFKDFDFAGMMDSILEKVEKFFNFINAPNEEKLATISELLGKLVDGFKAFFGLFGAKTVSASTLYDEETVEETEEFTDVLGKLKEKGLPILEDLAKSLTDLEQLKKIGLVGLLFSFVKVVRNISKVFGNASKVVKGAAVVTEGFEGLGKAVSGIFTAISSGIKGGSKGIKTIAKGIAEGLGSIGGAIKSFRRKNNAEAILYIATAIGVLSLALVHIGNNLTLEQAQVAAGIIFAVAGALGVVFEAFSRISEINRVNIKDDAAKKLGNFLNSIKGAVKNFLNRSSLAALAIGLGILITAVVSAIKKLSSITWGEALKGVSLLGVILFELSLAINSISKGKNKVTIGKAAMVASLALLVKSIAKTLKSFGNMSWQEILKGITSLGAVLLEMSLAINSISSGKNKVSFGKVLLIGSIALAIKSVASTLNKLANIPLDGVIPAMAMLGEIFGGMSIMMAASKKATKHWGSLIIMGLIIGEIGLIVGGLSLLDQSKIQSATLCIDSLMVCFGILEGASSGLTTAKGSLVLMGLLLGEMAIVLWKLSELPVEDTLGTATALSELVLALSGAVTLLTMSGSWGISNALIGIGELDLFIVNLGLLFGGIGALIDQFPEIEYFIDKGIPLVEKLGNGLGQFFGGILGGVAEGFSDSLPDVGTNLSTFATNAKGFFETISNFGEGSMEGIKALATFAKVVPRSGGLLQAFFGEVDIVKFGDGIRSLGKALKSYAENVEGIKPGVIKSSASAAQALAKLNDSLPETGGKLASWLFGEKDLEGFGKKVASFGASLRQFYDSIAGDSGSTQVTTEAIDPKLIEKTGVAAQALAKLNDMLPETGGKLTSWLGEKNLVSFGERLSQFGSGLRGYYDAITKGGAIDAQVIEDSGNAAQSLAKMQNMLPSTGGKLNEWFFGEKNLETFGNQLSAFGEALRRYNDAIAGDSGSAQVTTEAINTDLIEKSAGAAGALAELANTLPSTGGKLNEWFFGEKNLETFGNQLANFGVALKDYNDTIAGNLKTTLIEDSATAASALVELANGLSRSGGIWQDIFGEKSLENFGSELKQFAQYLIDYQTKLESIDFDKLSEVLPFLDDMISITEKANAVSMSGGGLIDVDAALQSLVIVAASCADTLYDSLVNDKSNTDKMEDAGEAVGNFISSGISSAIDTYRDTEISGKASSIVDEFVKAIERSTNNNSSAVNGSFMGLINSALSEVTSTINGYETELTNAISRLFNSALANISTDSLMSSAKNAGAYFAIGFANGIAENGKFSSDAASIIGSNAVTALNNAILAASPSKLTTRSGEFFGQGFVNGMKNLMGTISLTSDKIGTEAVESLTNPLQLLDRAFDTDLDINPVITPVIDMSNVEGGIGKMNAMAGQTNLLFKGISADSINGVGKIAMDYVSGFDDLHNDIIELHKAMQDSTRESGNSMALLRDDVNNFANNMQTSLNQNGSGVNLLRDDVNRFANTMQTSMTENGNRMNTLRDDMNLFASNMQTSMTENGNSVNLLRNDVNAFATNVQNTPPNTDNMALLNDIATLMNKYFPEFASRQVVLDTGAMVGEMTPMFDSGLRKIVNRRR